GRPGRVLRHLLRGEGDLLAVGRDRDLLEAAEGLRRRVAVEADREVDEPAPAVRPVGIRRPDEKMAPLPVLPRVPMAEEEVLVDARLDLALLLLAVLLGRLL